MADGTKVTRIKASDNATPQPAKVTKTVKPVSVKKAAKVTRTRKVRKNRTPKFLVPVVDYFKGAWSELRQVRWPDRRSTWGMTLAVILFGVFFLVLVTLLDALFKLMFEFIIS